MKKQGGLGIRYQLNFNCGSGRVLVHVIQYQKTLASLAKRSIGTMVSNMCYYNIKFLMATDFRHFLSYAELQINQYGL